MSSRLLCRWTHCAHCGKLRFAFFSSGARSHSHTRWEQTNRQRLMKTLWGSNDSLCHSAPLGGHPWVYGGFVGFDIFLGFDLTPMSYIQQDVQIKCWTFSTNLPLLLLISVGFWRGLSVFKEPKLCWTWMMDPRKESWGPEGYLKEDTIKSGACKCKYVC